MRQLRQLCAALLAICLCAAPASALESANNHPGGPFLYPIAAQPDDSDIDLPHLYSGGTAAAPAAPYSALWRSFYSAGQDVNWDRAYAGTPAQWESHNAEYPDRNTLFSLYAVNTDLKTLSRQLQAGRKLTDFISALDHSQGVVLNRKADGKPVGACSVRKATLYNSTKTLWRLEDPVSFAEASGSGVDRNQFESRAVLRLDASLKKQMEASGLRIGKTKAYSLRIQDYADGILFDDGEKQLFQPQFWVDRSIDSGTWLPEAQSPDDGRYYEECRLPTGSPSLSLNQLYPVDEVAKDITAIANSQWMVHWALMNKAPANTGKPVIYLYPEKPADVSVKLRFDGDLTYTYPAYNDGWNVTAYPDGRIVNKSDSSEHYYLFWEGNSSAEWTFDKGFCVKGGDTEKFLREKLSLLGLTPKEYNDFITYWVPRLQDNPYNLIKFADTEYEKLAPLNITPKPDTIARIHMVYRPLAAPAEIAPQQLQGFARKGFTVVEWGGTLAHSPS